jgi:hypothetical protein
MDTSTLQNIVFSLKEIYNDVKHDLSRQQMTEFERIQDNLQQFLKSSSKKKKAELNIKRLLEGISGLSQFKESDADGAGFWVTFDFYGNTHRMRFWKNGCPIIETCEPMDDRIKWKVAMVFQMYCPQVVLGK